MVSHAGQAAAVAVVTVAYTTLLLRIMYLWRQDLAAITSPLALPTLCLLCSMCFICITVCLVLVYGDPDVPLVNSFSKNWFSGGWNKNLVFMGVRIDSPVAYGLILNYQITRCVLGSLLANAFQPYVTALQSKLLNSEVRNPHRLLAARAFTDIYGFVSGLTDLILYMSQMDIFLVSGAVTILVNYLSTLLLLGSSDGKTKKSVEQLASDLEKTHPGALLFGGLRPPTQSWHRGGQMKL